MIRFTLLTAAAALALSACATAPKPLQGSFATLLPAEVGDGGQVGETIRWGGEIIAVETKPDRTCFELLGKRLSDSARPARSDDSAGRFLACRAGFYDPAKFKIGREMTITGTVELIEPRLIGEYTYLYPQVAAEVIYLWPDRTLERNRHADHWHGPIGRGWYGHWSPFFVPFP